MAFWKKSLLARLVSYFLLLSLLMVGLVAVMAYALARQALERSVFDRLSVAATLKEEEINQWVDERQQDVIWLASSPEVQAQAQLLVGQVAARQLAYEHLSEYLAAVIAIKPDLQEVFILADGDGKIILSTDKTHEGQYRIAERYFSQGRQLTCVQNVYPAPDTLKPAMTIATPLLDPAGRRLAVLAAHLNLDWMDHIILERSSLGASGRTYVIDKFKIFMFAERFEQQAFPQGLHSQGIAAAVQGQDGSGLYESYDGLPVVGVYRWLDERELALLVEVSQAEAFAPASQLGWNIFLIGLGMAGLLVVGVYLLVRRLATPVLELVSSAGRVARGELDQDVPVRSQDELGTLAEAFNAMQASLRESRAQLELHARTLEQRVLERTAELAQRLEQLNLINRVGRDAALLLDLDELLPHLTRLIRDTFDYYAVTILLLAADELCLSAIATAENPQAFETGLRLPLNSPGIAGHVASSGQALAVGDVSAEPLYRCDERLPHTRSELALPLRVGHRVLGVLDLQSEALGAFGPQDVQVLHTLADQIAAAIYNARLYQAEGEARRAADTLREIGQVVNSTLNLDEVLARILASLGAVLEYDSASIMLLKDGVLHLRAGQGFANSNGVRELQLPLAEYALNRAVIETARPLILGDVRSDPRWMGDEVPGSKPVRSWIGTPLIAAGQVIGMLTVDSYRLGAYSQAHLPLVTAFANQAAIALHNAELFQAAQAARAEAEEANRLKSRFLANMSHELRTPLNSVINFAYLLAVGSEGPVTPEQEDLLKRIGDAGRHLLGLINDILDLSKIEAGRLELFLEQVDLLELIEGVMLTAAGLLKGKPVELKQELPPGLPPVWADRTRVRQVLLNLLSNAAKFTERGHIVLRARADEAWVTLSVQDTGLGIAAEDIPKAFAEFVQLDGGPARQAGGTGLGLPISKRFVEMHGGRMWVDSQPGRGSTFYFTLPRLPSPPALEKTDEAIEARVLVIDDDPLTCEAIARQLSGLHGYQVTRLSDSRRVVECVRQARPDVVVLDILMPYQDGWEVLARLKSDPATRDIPVVVCSVLREQQLALSMGAAAYLVKPVEHEELRRVVEQFAPAGGKVLAVDDDPNALEIVSRMLDGMNYQVITAQDGQAGLRAAQEQSPDVVVLDLMMPGLSGFEVLAELRADPRTHSLPVIIVTAKDLSPEERAQLQSQAAGLLQKGYFTPGEFANTVRRAVLRAAQDAGDG